jgi:hypothetical protein
MPSVTNFPPIEKGVPMPLEFKGKWINYLNALAVGDSFLANENQVIAMRCAIKRNGSSIKISWQRQSEDNTLRVWRRK